MDLLNSINDMNKMVLEGKTMEAFEKYYAEDVVMQENSMEPIVGKEANRKREMEWFTGITEFRGAEVKNVAAGENVTMTEWFMDYSHKEYGDVKMNQVAIQTWQDGKIIKEVFYHE